MKAIILTALIIFGINSQAAILNSDLDLVHQTKIQESVEKNCFLKGDLTQLSSTVKVDVVDQGVRDFYYTTTFETFDKYDQVYSDKYIVTVNSVKWDMYDHETKNWGSYSVESVKCEPAK